MRRVTVLAAVLASAAALGSAQGPDEALEAQMRAEGALLERLGERYREARQREDEALARLGSAGRELDQALAGDAGLAEIREREQAVETARAAIAARGEEAAAARRALLAQLERLAVLEGARQQGAGLVREVPLTGRWSLEIGATGQSGELELRLDGTLVRGTYRLADGAQGSVEGSVAGRRVELRQLDARGGFVATLRGQLDPGGRLLHGTWQATEVSGGEPTSGPWTARRLAP